jgi:hypothetical protein
VAARERPFADPVQLGTRARYALGLVLLALVGSGLAWLGIYYADALGFAAGDELARVAREALALKFHGAAAMATLIALGAMVAAHARPAWRLRRNRASGSLVLATFAVLAATGYALYYFATDDARPPLSLVHWVTGLALVALLPVHLVLGRRTRAAMRRPVAPRRAS